MRNQRTHARLSLCLTLTLAVLALVIALHSAFTSVSSAKQSNSGSISFARAQENPLSLNRWSSNGPDGGSVLSLAVDPTNPANIYAGAGGGVFKSTNGGESWSLSLSPNYNSSTYALAIDPTNSNIIYAGGGSGLSRSTNGGASWSQSNIGPVSAYSLAIDPKTSTTLYAGFTVVSKSTDNGVHWNKLNTGPFNQDLNGNTFVINLAIDPSNPSVIFAAGGHRIIRSTDFGASWNESFDGSRVATFFALAVDPSNSNTIYAGGYAYDCCGGVVLKSTNNGATWSRVNLSGSISTFAIDRSNPNIVYAGGNGVFKTTNGGQTWATSNGGLAFFGAQALAIDPINPSTIYAGGSGVFKSSNGGANWTATNTGLRGGVGAYALAINPGIAGTVYTETNSGLFKSADNGGTWTANDFFPLAFDPRNPSTIYSVNVTGRYGLLKSTDSGATWNDTGLTSFFNGNRYVSTLAIDPNNSAVIYATLNGIDGGVFKSIDSGESWKQSRAAPDGIGTLAIDARNSNIIYAGGNGGLKSIDAGASWNVIGQFTDDALFVVQLRIDPANSQILYAVTYDGFSESSILYKSINGGENWSPIFGNVISVVVDPVRPNVVYAATYGDGISMSSNGGESWNSLNDGLTDLSVYALVIEPSGSFLHAGSQAGVFDYQFGCTYAPSLASQSFPAGGGSGSVTVTTTSGCNWQASSGVSWVMINSGSTGTGEGSVSFSVGANLEPFPRSTTLSVAGRPFTVNQFGAVPINQIDDTSFFLSQHYLDFLNRQPDSDGLSFWTASITECGFDGQCFEAKRINASAAFFLSIEFQQTGYFVYRVYKAAYGIIPGTPVPLTLGEFLPDTQQIGHGVIVNQTGWEQLLESNTQAFATQFVQRSRFTSALPTILTPAQFVDTLFTNSGVLPSAIDRNAAINEFGSATVTTDTAARARVLRRVADNSTLAEQEFNRAFVLMQYFGYLRRNPNDPPEPGLNFDGYNFWLTKLNQFNGNFQSAEMVKAFLASTEYRQRFGQQ